MIGQKERKSALEFYSCSSQLAQKQFSYEKYFAHFMQTVLKITAIIVSKKANDDVAQKKTGS